ncbi:hypothetical protein F5883DRAFT_534206 [Diaporthe sp. PMI_573]|nr:hypothetical protein F5883DRAFT_534206 [Diaporthaceae sp. PMI_573]
MRIVLILFSFPRRANSSTHLSSKIYRSLIILKKSTATQYGSQQDLWRERRRSGLGDCWTVWQAKIWGPGASQCDAKFRDKIVSTRLVNGFPMLEARLVLTGLSGWLEAHTGLAGAPHELQVKPKGQYQ